MEGTQRLIGCSGPSLMIDDGCGLMVLEINGNVIDGLDLYGATRGLVGCAGPSSRIDGRGKAVADVQAPMAVSSFVGIVSEVTYREEGEQWMR